MEAFILEKEKELIAKEDEVRCPECRGVMILCIWPIYICIPCHQRRSRSQAESGKNLIQKLHMSDVKEHSIQNPF